MSDADIIITQFDGDSKPVVKDYHSSGYRVPSLDDS
jgi:hypothetical protein